MPRKKKNAFFDAFKNKIEELSWEDALKFGLWASTSVVLFPILKSAEKINTDLQQLTNNLEAFTPWRGEFLTEGAFIVRDIILGRGKAQGQDIQTNDPVIALLSVLISYYLIYHPAVVATLGKDIIGLGRLFIGGSD